MGVEASFYEAHVARDLGRGPPIENELTEYIRATDLMSAARNEWATWLGGGLYFSLNKRD